MIPCLLSCVVWAYWASMESWSHGSPLGSERYWVTLGSEREVRTREMSSFIAGDKSCFFPFLVQLGRGTSAPSLWFRKDVILELGIQWDRRACLCHHPWGSEHVGTCVFYLEYKQTASRGRWVRLLEIHGHGDGLASFWLTSRLGTKKHKASRRQQTENSSPTRDTEPSQEPSHQCNPIRLQLPQPVISSFFPSRTPLQSHYGFIYLKTLLLLSIMPHTIVLVPAIHQRESATGTYVLPPPGPPSQPHLPLPSRSS